MITDSVYQYVGVLKRFISLQAWLYGLFNTFLLVIINLLL